MGRDTVYWSRASKMVSGICQALLPAPQLMFQNLKSQRTDGAPESRITTPAVGRDRQLAAPCAAEHCHPAHTEESHAGGPLLTSIAGEGSQVDAGRKRRSPLPSTKPTFLIVTMCKQKHYGISHLVLTILLCCFQAEMCI